MIGGTGGTMLDELYVLLGTRMDLKGLQAFERRIDATRRRMDAVGGQMMRWGATGAAAVGLIGNAVYQFEKKINAVNSVLRNATDEQKRRIKELTRELGATTQFTAPQAADAAFELAKAGFSPDEILDALPNVLNLAAAGDLGMAEAAKISVANLRGFKREVGELTDIMDMLAVASTSANTTIRELGLEALPNVAPIVAQMGGDIAPMMAMLARAQDAGIAASKTGVQMRQIMLRLITLAGFSERTKKMARPGELEGIDLAPSKAQKTSTRATSWGHSDYSSTGASPETWHFQQGSSTHGASQSSTQSPDPCTATGAHSNSRATSSNPPAQDKRWPKPAWKASSAKSSAS